MAHSGAMQEWVIQIPSIPILVSVLFHPCHRPIEADLTKYNYVVAALDNVAAGEVEALILSPPAENKYPALKSALIKAFGKTQAQKDNELLYILVPYLLCDRQIVAMALWYLIYPPPGHSL